MTPTTKLVLGLLGTGVVVGGVAWALSGDDEPNGGPDPERPKPPKPTPDPPKPDPAKPSSHPMKERPPEAVGDPEPFWPLLGDTERKVSDDLGACRPYAACKTGGGTRHHAGEDLKMPRHTIVLAPEDGTIVRADPEWYEGTGLLLLQTKTGIVINLGEIEPNSEQEFGVEKGTIVIKGQPVARVGWHEMLHFETYVDGTKETSQWPLGESPPASLLDPVPYLRLAAEQRTS